MFGGFGGCGVGLFGAAFGGAERLLSPGDLILFGGEFGGAGLSLLRGAGGQIGGFGLSGLKLGAQFVDPALKGGLDRGLVLLRLFADLREGGGGFLGFGFGGQPRLLGGGEGVGGLPALFFGQSLRLSGGLSALSFKLGGRGGRSFLGRGRVGGDLRAGRFEILREGLGGGGAGGGLGAESFGLGFERLQPRPDVFASGEGAEIGEFLRFGGEGLILAAQLGQIGGEGLQPGRDGAMSAEEVVELQLQRAGLLDVGFLSLGLGEQPLDFGGGGLLGGGGFVARLREALKLGLKLRLSGLQIGGLFGLLVQSRATLLGGGELGVERLELGLQLVAVLAQSLQLKLLSLGIALSGDPGGLDVLSGLSDLSFKLGDAGLSGFGGLLSGLGGFSLPGLRGGRGGLEFGDARPQGVDLRIGPDFGLRGGFAGLGELALQLDDAGLGGFGGGRGFGLQRLDLSGEGLEFGDAGLQRLQIRGGFGFGPRGGLAGLGELALQLDDAGLGGFGGRGGLGFQRLDLSGEGLKLGEPRLSGLGELRGGALLLFVLLTGGDQLGDSRPQGLELRFGSGGGCDGLSGLSFELGDAGLSGFEDLQIRSGAVFGLGERGLQLSDSGGGLRRGFAGRGFGLGEFDAQALKLGLSGGVGGESRLQFGALGFAGAEQGAGFSGLGFDPLEIGEPGLQQLEGLAGIGAFGLEGSEQPPDLLQIDSLQLAGFGVEGGDSGLRLLQIRGQLSVDRLELADPAFKLALSHPHGVAFALPAAGESGGAHSDKEHSEKGPKQRPT